MKFFTGANYSNYSVVAIYGEFVHAKLSLSPSLLTKTIQKISKIKIRASTQYHKAWEMLVKSELRLGHLV